MTGATRNIEPVQHVLLDFDGVLCDSRAAAAEEINALRRSRGWPLPHIETQDDFALVFSGPLKTSLRRFGMSDDQASEFFTAHSEAMSQRAMSLSPFAKAVRGLSERAPYQCSIVSSAYSDAISAVLGMADIDPEETFAHISGRQEGRSKGKRIADTLHRLDLDPSRVVYVGDLVSDILYSRDIGIRCVAVGYGYHPINYLSVFAPFGLAPTEEAIVDILDDLLPTSR
ncbi:MAG: HAD hydrolase-like protein [Actinobacteria bacterium]|nr:HAD hydrolase-like protein [Actinomycetota bacterium]